MKAELLQDVRKTAESVMSELRAALAVRDFARAREIAAEGVAAFPGDEPLQNMARAIAPPIVLRRDVPAQSELAANEQWMREHANEHRGNWVAVGQGKLLAKAPTLRELMAAVDIGPNILVTKIF